MLRISGKISGSRLARTAALRLLPLLSLILFLVASCATVPPSVPKAGWLAVLPPLSSDSLYASVDVASSWDLLKILAETTGNDPEALERVIAKLDRVHACIRLSPDPPAVRGPRLAVIAVGRFSTGPVARRLNADPSWERITLEPLPGGGSTRCSSRRSYRTFWRRGEVEIAVPERGLVFVAAGAHDGFGAEELLRRFQRPEAQPLPIPARKASESADIFFYIPDPISLALVRSASQASAAARSRAQDPGALLQNLPIRQGWISARRYAPGQVSDQENQSMDRRGYELEAVLLLDQVDNPRSVELLLRLMLTLWLRKVQVDDPVETLKTVKISVDAESARIDSFFLDDDQIVLFLQTLLPEMPGR
jgi:hypothetical protein